jgi:hypothetical protein
MCLLVSLLLLLLLLLLLGKVQAFCDLILPSVAVTYWCRNAPTFHYTTLDHKTARLSPGLNFKTFIGRNITDMQNRPGFLGINN